MPVYFVSNGEPEQGLRPVDAGPGERLCMEAPAGRCAMDGIDLD